MGQISNFFEQAVTDDDATSRELWLYFIPKDNSNDNDAYRAVLQIIDKDKHITPHSFFDGLTLREAYEHVNNEPANFHVDELGELLRETGRQIKVTIKTGVGKNYTHEFMVNDKKEPKHSKAISFSSHKIGVEDGLDMVTKMYNRELNDYGCTPPKNDAPKL